MTADKIALKAELYDLFVNLGFDVASLANALCMGRSKLYTKFKQLVGDRKSTRLNSSHD